MDDLISRDAVIEILADMQGRCDTKAALVQNSKIWQQVKDLPSAQQEQRWIPVAERLPENAKHAGALCPRYLVQTPYGVTEGWYNPDHKAWYALMWFLYEPTVISNLSMKRGDIPEVCKGVPVIAWMPLPEPYKGEEYETN